MSEPELTPSDVELMQRIASGDEAALRRLVERHQNMVFATALRMLGDRTEAEDITQLTFIRIYRAAPGYRPEAKFTTWMFTILRNLVFNESRRRQRHAHESLDAPRYGADEDAPALGELVTTSGRADETPTPAGEMLQRELEDAVQEALDTLPEQQRMAMVLLRYQDLSYEEIAAVLNTTVPAVKSLIFRARDALKQKLAKYLRAE
jgi:RNA polymerase sigma-70 factor (ECF subfamily)